MSSTTSTAAAPAGSGQVPLKESDPELFALIEAERERQRSGLELIASENFTSRAVMEALGSCLTNKYSEGLPGHRYYGGNEVVDRVERLCQQRALAAFGLDAAVWGVNVQPYSGSSANFEAYTAMLRPGDRLMGLDLPSGGHLTHGYQTEKKKISATSIYFESRPYRVDGATGLLDYAGLEAIAAEFRPHLVVAGASAYPRDWDYGRMRAVADAHGALLMADIAHISGIVAARLCADPFAHCDVVTTTTHKTLRGPRAGLIFFRRARAVPQHPGETLEERVNAAVFPACQGGPHENAIAAVATALHEVLQPEWRAYVQAVLANAAHLAAELVRRGHQVVTGGTDNHLVLWDVRPHQLTGSKLEKLFEAAAISVNKNAIFGDVSALSPGGVRLGLPSLTTRGLATADVTRVAEFLHRGVQIAVRIQAATGKQLKDFVAALPADAELQQLKADVEAFARTFPLPGL